VLLWPLIAIRRMVGLRHSRAGPVSPCRVLRARRFTSVRRLDGIDGDPVAEPPWWSATDRVPADDHVRVGQAAWWYSWRMPPRWSQRGGQSGIAGSARHGRRGRTAHRPGSDPGIWPPNEGLLASRSNREYCGNGSTMPACSPWSGAMGATSSSPRASRVREEAMGDNELSLRLLRAGINSLTEEFVPLVMSAHRPGFEPRIADAWRRGSGFSESISALGDDFCIEFRPDGLSWQFLVGPTEPGYLFELTHQNRWMIYRCGERALELVSYDGGPLPDLTVSDLKGIADDVSRRLGDYLRLYRIPLPQNTHYGTPSPPPST
jgi:hypothetical protein